MRLQSDLVDLCLRSLQGGLAGTQLSWDPRVALGVVMAAAGYPEQYAKGEVIGGVGRTDADDLKTFQAGTALADGEVVTAGGRVLCVVGLGENAQAAQQRAYAGVADIEWPTAYYRRDIGYRAIAREA